MKPAFRGRKGSSGSWYNRRRINDLEMQAAIDKMRHYLYRHSQGEKVKSFVPVIQRRQTDGPTMERRDGKQHLK